MLVVMATTQGPAPKMMGRGPGDAGATRAGDESAASIPLALAGIAELALAVRDDRTELERLLNQSLFPMLIVDGERRYLDANRPARLLFRRTLDEMRKLRIDDLTPPERQSMLEEAWHELITTGGVSGDYEVGFPDGSRLDVVYWALSYDLRSRHLIIFAPANWSEHEFSVAARPGAAGPRFDLTPRELEVLRLAAMGNSAAAMADQLVIGESTVKTHLANIYAKLGVSDRAAAVATAIRVGLID
jgi:DNA-binding CsgD family transcriptional regulator